MSGWSERDLARIGAADEILVAPDQGDRSRGPAVPIWVVRVGEELYVRSYRGASGGWYRRARFSRNGRIRSGGEEFRVRFSEVAAPELRAQIDEAYRVKYGRYGSRNVIDVDETLIKITTADTAVTARLPLTLTFLLRRRRLLEWHRSHRPRWP